MLVCLFLTVMGSGAAFPIHGCADNLLCIVLSPEAARLLNGSGAQTCNKQVRAHSAAVHGGQK